MGAGPVWPLLADRPAGRSSRERNDGNIGASLPHSRPPPAPAMSGGGGKRCGGVGVRGRCRGAVSGGEGGPGRGGRSGGQRGAVSRGGAGAGGRGGLCLWQKIKWPRAPRGGCNWQQSRPSEACRRGLSGAAPSRSPTGGSERSGVPPAPRGAGPEGSQEPRGREKGWRPGVCGPGKGQAWRPEEGGGRTACVARMAALRSASAGSAAQRRGEGAPDPQGLLGLRGSPHGGGGGGRRPNCS